jgi:hypothetical protein
VTDFLNYPIAAFLLRRKQMTPWADAVEKVGHENRATDLITRGESQCVVYSRFAKAFDKTPSEALGLASCTIVDYELVLPGLRFVRRAASKFKTVPSVALGNLVELMKEGRPETESQPSLPKSSYRGPCH